MSELTIADPVAEAVEGREFKLLIGGDLVDAVDGATHETVNPSTGEPLASVPWAGPQDVARAVEAAIRAAPQWAALGIAGRSEAFARLASAISERRRELALLDAVDGGMPYEAMLFDIDISLWNIRDWPTLVRWHGGRTIPASPQGLHYTSYRPYGVAAKIVPFNHPAMFAITRILPALIAGNAVVLKVAPQTPLSALAFGEAVRDVLPAGVVNILTGGVECGDALVTHRAVKRISFTGSVAVGMQIQQRAATAGVKALSLELGGKNPMIVFPDVDVDEAVAGALKGMNFGICTGQSCGSNSRVFVHREIYDEFLTRAGERMAGMKVAPAYADEVDMGPVVSAEHRARVMSYIESGREQGAQLVTGGEQPNGDSAAGGYFIAPTLFGDVTSKMKIAREEIFGPVIAAAPWGDYEDMIARANDTDLGLTASVWTNDLSLAHRTAERLEAGYVWINDSSTHYWGTPFGGQKNSGLGREECIEEYESYLELKAIHTMMRDPAERFERLSR
jgi:betaine-aldehyde dehydrogenase